MTSRFMRYIITSYCNSADNAMLEITAADVWMCTKQYECHALGRSVQTLDMWNVFFRFSSVLYYIL